MELLIQQWGNSAAVRLKSTLLELLNVGIGDKLEVVVLPEGMLLKRKRLSYDLADLVGQCDLQAEVPADLEAWNNLKPVGREVV